MLQRPCSINDTIVQDSIPSAFNSLIQNFIHGGCVLFFAALTREDDVDENDNAVDYDDDSNNNNDDGGDDNDSGNCDRGNSGSDFAQMDKQLMMLMVMTMIMLMKMIIAATDDGNGGCDFALYLKDGWTETNGLTDHLIERPG